MRALTALSLLSAVLSGLTIPAAARRLPIQVFTSGQGLPRNQVACMVPGPSGVLWLCSSEGLARFDGYNFRVFGPEHGLPSRNVLDLVPSRNGGFWLVTDAGFCRLALDSKIGRPCRPLPVSPPLRDFVGDSILETSAGETWIATNVELLRLSRDGLRLEHTSFERPYHNSILSLMEARNGALLVCTDFGIYQWRPGHPARNISASLGAVGVTGYVDLAPGRRLLASTGRLYELDDTPSGYRVRELALKGLTRAAAVLKRRDGSIWAAGNGGIARLAASPAGEISIAELFTANDGLPSLDLNGLAEDSQGNLWVSTEGSGIFRIADSGFVSYDSADGLGNQRIAAIFEDPGGRLYVETSIASAAFVLRFDGRTFRRLPIRVPPSIRYLGWGWNQLIVAAHNGEWWVPTGEGMLHFPRLARAEQLAAAQPDVFGRASELGCADVFRSFEDAHGDIWVGCIDPRLLARWDRVSRRFQRYGPGEGWPAEQIPFVFRQGRGGTFWVATAGQVVRFRDGKFTAFPLRPKAVGVRDLLIDRAGRLWVATWREGLFRCDNPESAHPLFRNYGVQDGLSATMVSSLAEDAAGYIYAGTARGVDRIDPASPAGLGRIRHFTAADGLPDSEQNTAYRDRRGRLWFGTLHGLAEFDPARAPHSAPSPVYLMRVRVRGEDVPLPWEGARHLTLDLAPNRNQVEIEFASIDLRSVQSLRYQYRLAGVDRNWSEPAESRSVSYASLPSGPLRFEVRALDPEGRVSPEPARFDLFVEAPLWRQWWFLGIATLLLLGTAIVLYDYRVRHLLAIERLRTRIATDLHDDIGASLSQISILSEVARRDAEPRRLGDIAEIARGLVQDMSDIVWEINPRHDRFDALVHRMRRFAGDALAGADIDLRFEAAGFTSDFTVPMEARRPLYLVFKEAINNVARHSRATTALVRLEREGACLKLTVQDNGRGFDPAARYDGEGLASIARRLRELDGAARWDSRPGQGAAFTAVLPLRPGVRHRSGG